MVIELHLITSNKVGTSMKECGEVDLNYDDGGWYMDTKALSEFRKP